MVVLDTHQRCLCCDVIGMHFGKCPINRCCLDAGEVVLLCDTPATLKQKKNLVLSGTQGSCSSSLDPGLVSLVEGRSPHV